MAEAYSLAEMDIDLWQRAVHTAVFLKVGTIYVISIYIYIYTWQSVEICREAIYK